jgi:hypothetical protein
MLRHPADNRLRIIARCYRTFNSTRRFSAGSRSGFDCQCASDSRDLTRDGRGVVILRHNKRGNVDAILSMNESNTPYSSIIKLIVPHI